MASSVFPSIGTSVKEQESWSSHSERQAPKLLFNHFQIVLLEGRGSCVSAPTSSAALIETFQSSVTVKDRGNGCILDWGYSFIQQLHLPGVYRSVHRRRKDGCTCGAEFQLFIDMAFLLKPHMNLMLCFLTWICSYQMCKAFELKFTVMFWTECMLGFGLGMALYWIKR